jgi:histone deacetylase 6
MTPSEEHYVTMETTQEKSTEELMEMARDYNSVYLHKLTFPCALLAAGSVIEMTEKVLQGKCPSGVAVVRPPGHHAVTEKCMGFCIFNSVAIAAKVAIDNHNISRILIVDWDVHHGNGTQEQFYDDKRVLYFSLHRYDNAMFYPKSTAAGPAHVGGVSAKGYNVNMAWNGSMMGDPEYLAAFHHLLLPIASEVVQRENEKTRKTRESLMYIYM